MTTVPTAAPSAPQLRRHDTVLIVDPASDAVAALHDALEESGYNVRQVADPDAALTVVRRQRPDLLLISSELPQGGALSLARQLRAEPATARLPLIFMSGAPAADAALRDPALGPVRVLTRPIRIGHLLERMVECLRGEGGRPAASTGLLDAHGHAAMVLRARDGRRLWQTGLARRLMREYFADLPESLAPPEVTAWAARESLRQSAGADPYPLTVARGARRLSFALHGLGTGHEGEWLLVLAEAADSSRLQVLARAYPTLEARDHELLLWLGQGATPAELADWLGCGPTVIAARLQTLCVALGVQAPESAANLARSRLAEAGLPLTVSP